MNDYDDDEDNSEFEKRVSGEAKAFSYQENANTTEETPASMYQEDSIDSNVTKEIEITADFEISEPEEADEIANPQSISIPNPENDLVIPRTYQEIFSSIAERREAEEKKSGIAVTAEQRLEETAVGMSPSYVLSPSRDPFRLNYFYESVKKIHASLKKEFKEVSPKVDFVLTTSNPPYFFQEKDVSFEYLEELLTEKGNEIDVLKESIFGEDRSARFHNYVLEPDSHVTFKIKGFTHIHVNYEKHNNPYHLFTITPGKGIYNKLISFARQTEGTITRNEIIKGGVLGLAAGALAAYMSSFNVLYALLAGFGTSAAKVSYDLASKPVYCATIDCDLAVDLEVPKEFRPKLASHMISFLDTLNEECSFQYMRETKVGEAMRDRATKRANEAKQYYK